MSADHILERLQREAAPELNFLLTEPPFRTNGDLDFGWYCREHAYCTVIVAALLGLACEIVRGDFIVRVAQSMRLSSIGTDSDHAWCTSAVTPVLDLSLHFKQFGPGPQLAEPIVRLGSNGIFDVRTLPEDTLPTATFDTDSVIGYIPRQIFAWNAIELIRSPSLLLPTHEAAEISARVALHTFRVMCGSVHTLTGQQQGDALAHLRNIHPEPVRDLCPLFDCTA